jgi:hypothetical protein
MPTRYHQQLTLPYEQAQTPLKTALSYAFSHPTSRYLLLWGGLFPLTSYFLFPILLLFGNIANQVESAALDDVTVSSGTTRRRVGMNRLTSSIVLGFKAFGVLFLAVILPAIAQFIVTMSLGFALTHLNVQPVVLWTIISIWNTATGLFIALVAPAGFIRTIRTGSVIAALSLTTIAATTSLNYLKAITITAIFLGAYLLLLPVTILIPFVGQLAWTALGAILLAGVTVYLASRTPGRPSEFTN